MVQGLSSLSHWPESTHIPRTEVHYRVTPKSRRSRISYNGWERLGCNTLVIGAVTVAGREAMKTIQLTPRQRKDIEERRRTAENRRIYQRLSVLLWIDDGRTREEAAQLVGVSTRQVGQWLRIFRNKGLEQLCTLHYQGDPGRLRPAQVERLKRQIATGAFHNAEQVRTWVREVLGVDYSATGVKE